jgi:flagellar motor switch protein FliN
MSSSPILLSSSDPPAAIAPAAPHPYAGLLDVPCVVDVLLGTGRITVRDCLRLKRLSVIRLHQVAGADLDVRVQDVSVAFGEAVIIDESTAIRISSIVAPPGVEGRAR